MMKGRMYDSNVDLDCYMAIDIDAKLWSSVNLEFEYGIWGMLLEMEGKKDLNTSLELMFLHVTMYSKVASMSTYVFILISYLQWQYSET